MNILIVGANGLLGRNLTGKLSGVHKVFAAVGKSNDIQPAKNINILQIDLANLDENSLPKEIDVIYYLAQSNRFREFPDGVVDMLDINVYAPVKLANWAQKDGVKKFIYTSSGGVYKNPTEPVHEFLDINANEKNGFYLDSKLSAEILLRNFSKLFETFVIVRPFFMYGPGQNRSMLIPRLIDNVAQGNEITLAGEEGIKINPIYIEDAAVAMEKLLKLDGELTFNIGGSEVVSLRELAETIGSVVSKKPLFNITSNIQSDLIADISMMKAQLIGPSTMLVEGLEKTYKVMMK